jgi:phosphoglycerate dehydrogenase-like enzyme
VPAARPWRLLSLAPTDADRVHGWFAPLPDVEVVLLEERSADAVHRSIVAAEIVLPDWSGALRVTAADVGVAARLAFVQSASVGLDSLDVEALTAAGIPVAHPAGINAPSVAEWCLAAALAVWRDLPAADRDVRDGRWDAFATTGRGNRELARARVGILGFGAVGSRTARLFAAIGADVAYWTRTPRSMADTDGVPWLPLEGLIGRSDVLVSNLALVPDTVGLIDAHRLALLPADAVVIDAGRGGIVDHAALLAGIRSGAIRGAAIDVFEHEPLPADSPLRAEPRILLSPHAASATRESIDRTFRFVVANIARGMRGEALEKVANGVDPVVRRRA